MVQVYLTRRNLLTLLAKLDGAKNGVESHCTLIKNDMLHFRYPQTHEDIHVTALEDEEYYTDRRPGPVREQLEDY